ncbi:MAG: hypothetical protein O7C61_14365 [SAR324 cluster bacterium]|nr:hypothetical protein [SAR324 cluster bacterium]
MAADTLRAEALTFSSADEVIEAFHERRWTDGLPIIPPTEERVRAMIDAAGRPGPDVVGVVPPRWAEATVEHVAINAVMAGCLPAYMPVLTAAIEAACDPAFVLYSVQATTHPCAVLMVVTGPIVEELGLNYSHGVFAPGNRANASLGRAMRLVLINVGGAIPGHGDQSTQGSPAKFSYCIAENEAATPWEPFRVEKGFSSEDSTVTVYSGEAPHNVNEHVCDSPFTTLRVIASVMTTLAHNHVTGVSKGDCLVVLGPEHAHSIAAGGLSRRDVQTYFWETARNPVSRIHDRGPHTANWPEWVNQEDMEAMVPIVAVPEDIHILVAGGPGKHSCFIPTFGFQRSVTRKIERG